MLVTPGLTQGSIFFRKKMDCRSSPAMTKWPTLEGFYEQHRPVIASATRSSSVSFSWAYSCACA
jgi:hypothetical protein